MPNPDPFDLSGLVTPISGFSPREVTPIAVRELRELRLKEAILDEVDKRFQPLDDRMDRIETKQDENFKVILQHVTRKSVMETLASNTAAVVIIAMLLLVLAVGYTQADVIFDALGVTAEVHSPLIGSN